MHFLFFGGAHISAGLLLPLSLADSCCLLAVQFCTEISCVYYFPVVVIVPIHEAKSNKFDLI